MYRINGYNAGDNDDDYGEYEHKTQGALREGMVQKDEKLLTNRDGKISITNLSNST